MDKFAIRCSDSEPDPLSALQVNLQLHSPREANRPKRSIDPSNNTDKLRNGILLACLEQIEAPEGDDVPFLNCANFICWKRPFDISITNSEIPICSFRMGKKGARDSEMQPSLYSHFRRSDRVGPRIKIQ